MKITHRFFKTAGVSAFIYASAMILQEIIVKYWASSVTPDVSFGDTIRSLAILIAFFFIIIAYLGITFARFSIKPAASSLAFLFSFIFAIVEISYRSVELFTIKRKWATAYFQVSDPSAKQSILSHINTFEEIVIGLYFVIIMTHMLASLFYGYVTWNSKGLEKVVSVMFFINATRLLCRLLSGYGHMEVVDKISDYMFAPVMISLYGIVGIWLWRFKPDQNVNISPAKS